MSCSATPDSSADSSRSPRILIVRLSAIGDVIHTMPVLCALRAHFPQAMIAWAVEERAAVLLRGHEALDELIELPRGFLKSPGVVLRLRNRLRERAFDVAIDTQGLTKSALVGWLSGAKRRIGLARPAGRELSPWFANERVLPTATHVIDQNLELLVPLGIQRPEVRFQVPEDDADRQTAGRWILEANMDNAAGVAIVNPGAGWPSKLWPPERYAQVARHLGLAWRLGVLVVWAGAAEKAAAETIVAGSEGVARLAPATTLRQLASLARRASLFVGADTGPLHLAVAVGTPCVGLFGPWPAERNGPLRPAAHRRAENGLSRPEPQATSRPVVLHGSHRRCFGLRRLR